MYANFAYQQSLERQWLIENLKTLILIENSKRSSTSYVCVCFVFQKKKKKNVSYPTHPQIENKRRKITEKAENIFL